MRLIFSDRSSRIQSVITLAFLLLLISAKYVQDSIYALAVGIPSLFLFSFLFNAWILLGIRYTLPGGKKAGQFNAPRHTRNLYIAAGAIAALNFLLFSFLDLIFLFLVINGVCYAWAFIENVYLAQSIYEIAGKVAKSRRGARLALHFLVAGVYACYLLYKVIKSFDTTPAAASTLPFAIDQNILDWSLSLAMFLYAFGETGARYLLPLREKPAQAPQAGDIPQADPKFNLLVMTVLFIMLGFHLFVDGLPALIATLFNFGNHAEWLFNVQEGVYNLFRLSCFLPIMLVKPHRERKQEGTVPSP